MTAAVLAQLPQLADFGGQFRPLHDRGARMLPSRRIEKAV